MKTTYPTKDHPSSSHELLASPQTLITVNLDGQEIVITDSDLIEQVEATAPFMRSNIQKRVAREQVRRNEVTTRRAEMSPVQRRRDIAREIITENPLDKADIYHIHSVLALCGLPYRKPPEGILEYEREYGRMSLSVESGKLKDLKTGTFIRQGLPYGPKARLLMLHICTRALRQKSPEVDIENSLSAFIESMGIHKNGGKRGSFNAFKEQLNRLAACRMQIGLWNGSRAVTINTNPISRFDVWLPPSHDPNQRMLWNSSITLSRDFYDSLQRHALPVDIRSLSALSHSAKQMDLLLWMSYRLKELNKPYFLSWELMKEQFCQSSERRMIDFQRQFKQDLQDIEEIFDKTIPVELGEKGLILKPCDPEGLFVAPDKKLSKSRK